MYFLKLNSRELHDSRREKAQFSLTQLYRCCCWPRNMESFMSITAAFMLNMSHHVPSTGPERDYAGYSLVKPLTHFSLWVTKVIKRLTFTTGTSYRYRGSYQIHFYTVNAHSGCVNGDQTTTRDASALNASKNFEKIMHQACGTSIRVRQ